MQPIRQTYIVPADNILHLKVPNIPRGQEVDVFIVPKETVADKAKKHLLMAGAATDPLFLADIEEITLDFSEIDSEIPRS